MQTMMRPDERTLIVRERLLPRDWVNVHEGHDAKAQVQIYVPEQDELGQASDVTAWEAQFDLSALGSTGCLVSTHLTRKQRPFPIQNGCQITIPLPDGDSIIMKGHIEHPDIRRKGETRLRISFRNLSASDLGKLAAYRDFLRDPPPVGDEVTKIISPPAPAPAPGKVINQLAARMRRRLPLALGLAALAAFSPESTAPNIPATSAPTPGIQAIQANCRVRFSEGVYFPKCGDTLDERRSTKLEFLPRDKQPTQARGLTLRANLQFQRGGRSCETVIPVELMKGETIEGSVRFTCDESPR